MDKHGGPASFGFWKSIIIALMGAAIVIAGLALFEKSIIATLILVLIGSMVIMVAAEAGKGKIRGIMRDPHSLTMRNYNGSKGGLNRDLPQNPWDAVSKKKDE